jgi:steroid delta-isomerase-like uncharacterized protein
MADNTALARRFYDEFVNAGRTEVLEELVSEDLVEHEEGPVEFGSGRDGVAGFFAALHRAFPDLHVEVEDVISSGDRVAVRARMTGTHQGDFMGMPPSGKHMDVEMIDIVRVGDDGRAVEHWGQTDVLSMMRQLGAMPAAAPA